MQDSRLTDLDAELEATLNLKPHFILDLSSALLCQDIDTMLY